MKDGGEKSTSKEEEEEEGGEGAERERRHSGKIVQAKNRPGVPGRFRERGKRGD